MVLCGGGGVDLLMLMTMLLNCCQLCTVLFDEIIQPGIPWQNILELADNNGEENMKHNNPT